MLAMPGAAISVPRVRPTGGCAIHFCLEIGDLPRSLHTPPELPLYSSVCWLGRGIGRFWKQTLEYLIAKQSTSFG